MMPNVESVCMNLLPRDSRVCLCPHIEYLIQASYELRVLVRYIACYRCAIIGETRKSISLHTVDLR